MNINRQHGFAVLEAILIIVVVGIIGFTGWFVWQSKQSAETTVSQTNKAAESIADNQSNNVVLKTYKNAQYNFQFSYPASWGAPEVSRGSLGIDVHFRLDKETLSPYIIAINDASVKSSKTDAPFYNIADYQYRDGNLYVIYIDGTKASNFKILKHSDDTVIFTGGDFGKYVVGVKKITNVGDISDATVAIGNQEDTVSTRIQNNAQDILSSFEVTGE